MSVHPFKQSQRRNSGMTLVEVLIAAVVLGIGLLGVAALQVNALQGSGNAQFRSKATDLTSALVDRVRANLDALNTYNTAAATCAATTPADICSMDADDTANGAADCSPDQMALYDLWDIRCKVEDTLPGGQITVACPGGCLANTPMQIIVSWQTQNADAAFRTEQVETTIIPGASIFIPGTPVPGG
ncbi:MAG: type IV pilus modification protein PilV [Candidatus Thiodiazotropha sp. (ex Cardiolucina cf. quadrata)]|nr:type IV pilus modification protein PilV [Candidatus Thiodiazotropha sp. (ex Cardiolucina cf. quadrata)]